MDLANDPRIGDFGLATSGQLAAANRASTSNAIVGDQTHSIGTTFYVAPEVRSHADGRYNEKVDMYSLGIIFFEMCHALPTAMERDHVLRDIRRKDHTLPPDFAVPEKAMQGDIILSLLDHRPSDRPASRELLKSSKLPVQVENETLRQALLGVTDKGSAQYQKILSTLFSAPISRVNDQVWDMASSTRVPDADDVILQGMVKEKLIALFRRHGATEHSRPNLFPLSEHYSSGAVRLLDSSGTLLQLPYDLTLANARSIAKHDPPSQRSFAFGNVFRESINGSKPRSHGEVDFDIVTSSRLDLALTEAEVLKVLDEVTYEFPSLSTAQMCFHINHSKLLDTVLAYARINEPQRPLVKEVISKLNVGHFTWSKIRSELRSPSINISSTSIDDLMLFDFRDTAEKAFERLRTLFEGTSYLKDLTATFSHINQLTTYVRRFQVSRKVYISPLSSFNEKFYKGGILFLCLYDTKKRDVFAAGGRYDQLVHEFRPTMTSEKTQSHAVGFALASDRLCISMARYLDGPAKKAVGQDARSDSHGWMMRRCDVLVASHDANALRTTCIDVLQNLWAQGISAELAVDTSSPDELLSLYSKERHSWIIIIRHDSAGTSEPNARVKSVFKKEDFDVKLAELGGWLRGEMRDREHYETTQERARRTRRHSISEKSAAVAGRDAEVQVLFTERRGKKTNRRNIVEAALSRSQDLVQTLLCGDILAIETQDDILDALRATRLDNPDSWRKVIQAAPLAEKKYLGQVRESLAGMANKAGGSSAGAFVYNFRTGYCIYYDLGRSSS